jgi:hypothetical protein
MSSPGFVTMRAGPGCVCNPSPSGCPTICSSEATSASLTATGIEDCGVNCPDGRHNIPYTGNFPFPGFGTRGCADNSCTIYNGMTFVVPRTTPCGLQLEQGSLCDSVAGPDGFAVFFESPTPPIPGTRVIVEVNYFINSFCDAIGFAGGTGYGRTQDIGPRPQNCAGRTITFPPLPGAIPCLGGTACHFANATLVLDT